MLRKKLNRNDEILDKLEYIGLDLEDIPNSIKKFTPIEYKVPRIFNEKQQYKQYKFVPIKDIQILLTPTNRLDSIQDKYKKALPLTNYLDNKSEKNVIYHATFLNMLKKVKIEEIQKVEEEQKKLSEKIPFKVRFQGNYLWQIYYSEATEKYFMLVTTEDTDYSTFFYLLKKKLENNSKEKIFVPISGVNYSRQYLNRIEIEDIENYLRLFTKSWPLIYEVYDSKDKFNLQIIGETEILENIKSFYKIVLKTSTEASQLYKLLKAIFILQTELPNYYEFKTRISRIGGLEFYHNDEKIEYLTLSEFLRNEYILGEEKKDITRNKIAEDRKRLEQLKQITREQEIEYVEKEKQITTFLECKKSFFGKFKYYFKYSKKSGKNKIRKEQEKVIEKDILHNRIIEEPIMNIKKWKKNYTIEELVEKYKELEMIETEMKNIIMDINATKLKNKNLAKKIENATAFIQEIDNHKKSIFEFWKYTNKDEVSSLPEGEEEEVNIVKRIEKVFHYQEDTEALGKEVDNWQRRNLSKQELDSCYIATTDLLPILNKIKTNDVMPKEIEASLRNLKRMEKQAKQLTGEEEFDIFGSFIQDNTKMGKIGNSKHREKKKDKFSILEINQNTKALGYKLELEKILTTIRTALQKNKVKQEFPIYKAMPEERIKRNTLQIFNINPEEEMKKLLKAETNKLYFYQINLKEGTNAIGITNSIIYDNQNNTLPIGMDLSTEFLIDISLLPLVLKEKTTFKILDLQEKDEFAEQTVRNICLLEYELDEEKRNKKMQERRNKKKEILENKAKQQK